MKKKFRIPGRVILTFTGALLLLVAMLSYSRPQIGKAAPGDLSSAVSKYPNLSGSSLQSCDLCHTASIPSLNPYGSAYKSKGRSLSAFGAIENLDSDGDGATNIQEINALTFPGNSASKPVVPTATKTQAPAPTNTPVPVSTNTPVPASTNTPAPNPTNLPNSTNTPIPPTAIPPSGTSVPNSASVTTSLSSANIAIGNFSIVTVTLNNVPAAGITSAEFACTFNMAVVEVSNITVTGLFGADSVTAINGPQNGSFIVAIAGSNGNRASTSGPVFTFSARGLQAGQSAIDCQARISTGNLALANVPSTPASLVVGSTQGAFAGQVLAGKPVTVMLYGANTTVTGSVVANADGTFNLASQAGNYTAVAVAPGFLKAQGPVTINNGATTTFQPITLIAGDIDGNDVIDQFDALTIGINYNGSAPSAADLNNDGTINVLDLEILALHYHQSGSQAWH